MRIPSSSHDFVTQQLQALRSQAVDGRQPLGTTQRLDSRPAMAGISIEVTGAHGHSPVDEARVESLRGAIADGSYQLQPLATAKALIAAKDLLELQP